MDIRALGAGIELIEAGDLSQLSIEGVADLSGVPKSSIYRRWPTRREFEVALLEAYLAPDPAPAAGSTRDALVDLLAGRIRRLSTGPGWQLALRVLAHSSPTGEGDHADERLREILQAQRSVFASVLAEGVNRGDIDPGADIDTAVDMILGAMWARVLAGEPPQPGLSAAVIDLALHGILPRGDSLPSD